MVRSIFFFVILGLLWSCGGDSAGGDGAAKRVMSGKEIYQTHCAICHGADGKKGLAGAKMLPDSRLTVEERVQLISQGKGSMMPYKGILSKEEIHKVAEFTLTLQ